MLEVSALNVGYRKPDGRIIPAVIDVSFELGKRLSLGVVGESGSGKSTLARALVGHCRPGGLITSGSVRVDGVDVFNLSKGEMRNLRGGSVAFVPQNPLSSLTPHLRVGTQVEEAVRIHNRLNKVQARARVLELLAATNLPDPRGIYGRYPHELSGGQRQRVVIAAALAGEPDLVILDEPTTALDKTTELQVLELIREIQREFNTSLIYVSHDLNAVSYMCDRVMVMLNGRVVEKGVTKDVYNEPSEDYTRELIAAIPRVSDSVDVCKRTRSDTTLSVLRAENLSYTYSSRNRKFKLSKRRQATWAKGPAVDRVSFTVSRAETMGLVGESGSGKSTVASIVTGLIAAGSGQLTFEDQRLPKLARERSAELRRDIQIIFQDPLSSLNPRQRVETILMRPLEVFFGLKGKQGRDRVCRLLEAMHLEQDILECYPRQLSGGQQQRVAVARAFAAQPKLIICDEITSALDVSVQAKILELLKELQGETGVSCLFITHDLGVIRRIADTVAVMHNGRICEFGPVHTVLDSPSHDYTRLLLAAANKELSSRYSQETRSLVTGNKIAMVSNPGDSLDKCYVGKH